MLVSSGEVEKISRSHDASLLPTKQVPLNNCTHKIYVWHGNMDNIKLVLKCSKYK